MKKKLVAVLVGLTVLGLVGCKENEQVELPLATPTAGVTEEVVPTEIPTPTEVPVPTEIPTLTEVPVPTEMPAPTATPVPTEAPVPTATSTPITTLTEAPAPTATPTPVPTATPAPTATPIPTATPAPTATLVPTVKIREVKSKELLEDGEIFVQSGGGVIITKKDGMYGAVNMDGEELVKHTYSSWWSAPNKDGQFALVNEEAVVCFDAKGRVIYTIENLNRLYINEGYITYIYSVKNEGANAESRPYHTRLGVYDIKKKMLLDIEQPTPNVEMVTPVVDGKFYVTWAYYDGTEIKEVDVKTLEQRDVQSDWWCKLLSPKGEYGAIMANLFGNHWVGLLGVDGKEEYRADILEMIAMYEIPSNNGCNYNVISYSEDGTTYYNRGKQVVIYIKSNDDGSEHYFLMDFSKAKVEEKKIENEYNFEATEPVVTNLGEVIIAHYDYIGLSASGNYLASKGDDWFYIDKKGENVRDYVDCSDFAGGYALVVEGDGMAYVVDTEFNKVSEGYPADGVYVSGDMLCVEKGEEVTYLYVTGK